MDISALKNNRVTGIGAANVDIYCQSQIEIIPHYDHPAIIKTTSGGVTRNIMENISRLGADSVLLTAVGNDVYSSVIIDNSVCAGINMDYIKRVEGVSSGIFMQVQDKNNDMHLAMCDMSVIKHLDTDYIKKSDEVIRSSDAIVIDPSLPEELIKYVTSAYGKSIKIFMDPVSDFYAKKMTGLLSGIYCIKPNRTELKELSGMNVDTISQCIAACKSLCQKGVCKIYVSLGKEGALYVDSNDSVVTKKLQPVENMVNASGAGDSFFATLICCELLSLDTEKSLEYASAAGAAAVLSEDTINKNLSFIALDEIISSQH